MKRTNNAMTKHEGSETLSASDYAYVPDPNKPSTWKLRIDDAQHVGGAIAAIGKGFRGQKVTIPPSDMAKVKAKLRAAWLKFHPDMSEKDLPDTLNSRQSTMVDSVISMEEILYGDNLSAMSKVLFGTADSE